MSTTNFDRYDLNTKGDSVREEFSNVIYNIDPTRTPFMSSIGRQTSGNTLTEWQTDSLAAVDPTNAAIDGADAGTDSSADTARVGNYHQISTKTIKVSGRADAVNKAGRRTELAYQLSKAAKSLKRDMEAILTSNNVAAPGSSSVASTTAGFIPWVQTNFNTMAASGSSAGALSSTTYGYPDTAATLAGVDAALTETKLRSAIEQQYTVGGDSDRIMVAPALKTIISTWMFNSSARVATLYRDTDNTGTGQATATGAVDVFVSDFGALTIEPNRFIFHNGTIPNPSVLFIFSSDMWAVSYLRNFRTIQLSTTGDAQNRELLVDYALVCKNEAASAIITDISSGAMTA
jgi:hypothetical protein